MEMLEPRPGISADWLVLGIGWAAAPLLVLAGSALAAATALAAGRAQRPPRRSAVAAAAARAGAPVPALIGTRFALEPGRGRSAVPVRPALMGAAAGVLGVLAAFTFSAGVTDAAANPARFGQTNQLETYIGENGQDPGPVGPELNAVAASRDVTGFDNALVAVAQSGQVSVTTYTYDPVGGKRLPVVLTAGRLPTAPDEIVLAPTTAKQLHATTGSAIRLTGGAHPVAVRVSGVGFVPEGAHNEYDSGAWVSPAGYDRLFSGAHYRFKFHVALISLRPGADVAAAGRRLSAIAASVKGGQGAAFFAPPPPDNLLVVKDVAALPLALGAFLALLAVGAVGHALATAVNRRRSELAVLRALGMTRRQSRLVVVTQASVLAAVGLAVGVPLGLAFGRFVWRLVALNTPLAYHPPLALWALVLIGPVALLAANLLAAWPGQHAARLRSAQILRAE
jgi:FtsX-like permease family